MVRPGDAIGMSTNLFSFLFLFLFCPVLSPTSNVWPFSTITIETWERVIWSVQLSHSSFLGPPRLRSKASLPLLLSHYTSYLLALPIPIIQHDHPLHRLHHFSPCHRPSTLSSATHPPSRPRSHFCTSSHSSLCGSLPLPLLLVAPLRGLANTQIKGDGTALPPPTRRPSPHQRSNIPLFRSRHSIKTSD